MADQLASFLQRTVARHHRAANIVATHDPLEQILAATLGKLLHSQRLAGKLALRRGEPARGDRMAGVLARRVVT